MIEREIRAELKEKAEDQAIQILRKLKKLLITTSNERQVVLELTRLPYWLKLAVVDATGKFLERRYLS